MALKLMYITNDPKIASIAQSAGVDRIFIDMEYIGKDIRQGGMNTVQNHHTVEDVKTIRKAISKSELMVRCNPIHDATSEYCSTEEEINAIIDAGADIIMLPFFKCADEVKRFVCAVDGRCKTYLLLETPEAKDNIDEILDVAGVDEIHIGLNDLSLGLKKKFMFELLCDGTVEELILKFRKKGIPYGFGGIASLGKGLVPAEMIIKEHYRMGSQMAILSRSFCDTSKITDLDEIKRIFDEGVKSIRKLEDECRAHIEFFESNRSNLCHAVKQVVKG